MDLGWIRGRWDLGKSNENRDLKYYLSRYLRGILCEMYQVWHRSDWDFNVIQYIGLFSPKNKLGKVKKLYSQNFSKYDPLKSEGGTSRLAITFLLIIENIHMHSDFSLEKDALSCGNGHFQFQMNRKKFNLKNPRTPRGHFFFEIWYFS